MREPLRFGALLNEADSEGQTASHRTSEQGNMAVADLLVRSGSELNASRSVANHANGETVEHMPILGAYVRGHFRVAHDLHSMAAADSAHAIVCFFPAGLAVPIGIHGKETGKRCFGKRAPSTERTGLRQIRDATGGSSATSASCR